VYTHRDLLFSDLDRNQTETDEYFLHSGFTKKDLFYIFGLNPFEIPKKLKLKLPSVIYTYTYNGPICLVDDFLVNTRCITDTFLLKFDSL
jgi:hypothetical protein